VEDAFPAFSAKRKIATTSTPNSNNKWQATIHGHQLQQGRRLKATASRQMAAQRES